MTASASVTGSGRRNQASKLVLEVRNLKTHFFTRAGVVFAVDDVSFSVSKARPSASSVNPAAGRA